MTTHPELQLAPETKETAPQTIELRRVGSDEAARAAEIICRDSNFAPGRYLEDTTVPHGGE